MGQMGPLSPLTGQGSSQSQGPAPRPVQAPVSDDVRTELVTAAQQHERRNRPRYLIVLAILVTVGAAIYLSVAASDLKTAREELQADMDQTFRLRGLGEKLLSVQAEMDSEDMRQRLDPSVPVFAELDRLAREAGLIQGNNFKLEDRGTADPIKDTDLVKKKWNATLIAQPAEAIFRWLTEASKINGVEVSFINEFKPGAGTPEGEPRWDCSIIFVRIQRKVGGNK
jgi:hypothetical protein